MRIVVWGINYAPESIGIGPYNTALCEFLKAQGHDVEMVTTFSYYPMWKKAPEDRGTLYRTDDVNGVRVHRCWHYVPSRVWMWKRMIHEATFVATSLLRVLSLPRPAVIVVVSPPLMLGPAAWLACLVRRTKFVFHVQDLQPDAALSLGMLQPNLFTRLLYAVERFAYRAAWRVSGISDGILRAFASKGVPAAKIVSFPNSITPQQPPARGAFRSKHGLASDDFLAVYSGNIGAKQGLRVLIDAARLLDDPRIKIVICGNGAERPTIEREAESLANVRLLNLLPDAEFREMLADSDVSVITQLAGAGHAFFPSKLLTSLAFGLPVLAVGDEESELTRAVRENSCGVCVAAGDARALADALIKLAADPEALCTYGSAGLKSVERFEAGRVLTEFERVLREA